MLRSTSETTRKTRKCNYPFKSSAANFKRFETRHLIGSYWSREELGGPWWIENDNGSPFQVYWYAKYKEFEQSYEFWALWFFYENLPVFVFLYFFFSAHRNNIACCYIFWGEMSSRFLQKFQTSYKYSDEIAYVPLFVAVIIVNKVNI